MRPARARDVALLDPVGDAGIGGYSYELAGGLAASGARVALYTKRDGFAQRLPRRVRLLPVLGAPPDEEPRLLREAEHAAAEPMAAATPPPADDVPPGRAALDPYFALLERRRTATAAAPRGESLPTTTPAAPVVRREPPGAPLTAELAEHLARAGHDTVWTQWPELGEQGAAFRARCRALGLRIVHTVHNVLPHERFAGDVELYDAVYRDADALVVHSRDSASALAAAFPHAGRKVVHSRHGLYTIYPRRPASRAAVRRHLGLDDETPAFLCFGGVRPYKNVDAVLHALADPRCAAAVLIVAGSEWGYPDALPGDGKLGRTRRLAERLGVAGRVRLLPGPFGVPQTSELFEACDAVVLPYIASYGSGVLCMAMTFGRHVVASGAGGMHEYFEHYPARTPLAGTDAARVADGLAHAAGAIAAARGGAECRAPESLAWPAVAAAALRDLG